MLASLYKLAHSLGPSNLQVPPIHIMSHIYNLWLLSLSLCLTPSPLPQTFPNSQVFDFIPPIVPILPHVVQCSLFPKCPIVSRRHLHTYLWPGDLVKALWPPRKSNYTCILPPIDIYNLKKKKMTNVSPRMMALNQKWSPAKPFPPRASNDD